MRCRSPLTQSTTGSCTTRMGPLLGTTSAATEKPGRTSPSTKVAKAARRRMGRRATWSTGMRSRSSEPCPAAGYSETAFLTMPSPFKIPNTFEARAAIGPVQNRIRGQSIAIIGLGGTGAYVLDLIAKTPVQAIHLLDSDHVDWHNLMRAPGTPTDDEIEFLKKNRLDKVAYYQAKYDSLRDGIHAHAVRVDSSTRFAEFLSEYPVDYAFVCIDQRKECDSPRQDVVYASLSKARVSVHRFGREHYLGKRCG